MLSGDVADRRARLAEYSELSAVSSFLTNLGFGLREVFPRVDFENGLIISGENRLFEELYPGDEEPTPAEDAWSMLLQARLCRGSRTTPRRCGRKLTASSRAQPRSCKKASTKVATMPSGSCVVVYEGKRGRVFRAKFRDTDGRQVQQTLGTARDGWTQQRAERELGKLLDKVDRERWRKPTGERLSSLVADYLDEYLPSRGRRRSTIIDYTNTLRRHVLPTLGDLDLRELETRPELLDRYIAAKRREGLSPKTSRTTCGRCRRCSSTRVVDGV